MPTIIDASQFDKNLNSFAHQGPTEVGRICYFISSNQLYKLTEINLIDPSDEIDTCVTIHLVNHQSGDDDVMALRVDELYDDGNTESSIITTLLRESNETLNRLVGRIALRKYSLLNYANEYESAPQVAAVKVEREYQQRGIITASYLSLLNWYDYLVSDDYQTVSGAKIWANSLSVRADVQIYDGANECFCGILGPSAIGNDGFKPWCSAPLTNLHSWAPNLLQDQPQKFIVLVLSREFSPEVGYAKPFLRIGP